MAHSADMARLVIALALAACVVGVTRAAAVKGRVPIDHPDHPDFPKPLVPAARGPCPIKKLPCVPVYSESAANRLAELGHIMQVAVEPDWPFDEEPPPPPPPPAPAKGKRPCRRGGDCRRKHKNRPSALQSLQPQLQQQQQQQ